MHEKGGFDEGEGIASSQITINETGKLMLQLLRTPHYSVHSKLGVAWLLKGILTEKDKRDVVVVVESTHTLAHACQLYTPRSRGRLFYVARKFA